MSREPGSVLFRKYLPWLGIGLFLVVCVGYVIELHLFRQTLDLKRLLLGSLLTGLAVGYEIGYRVARPIYHLTQRFITHTAVLIVVLMLFPLLASWLNRGLALRVPQTLAAEVYQRDTTGRPGYASHTVHLWHPDIGLVRVKTDTTSWSRQPAGTPVRLDLQTGLFGVRYVVPGIVR